MRCWQILKPNGIDIISRKESGMCSKNTSSYDDEANDQADAHALLMQSQRDKNKGDDDEIQ